MSKVVIVVPLPESVGVALSWGIPYLLYGLGMAGLARLIVPLSISAPVKWVFLGIVVVAEVGCTIVFLADCYAAVMKRLRVASQEKELRLRSELEIRRLENEWQ